MNCPHCQQEMENGRLRIKVPGRPISRFHIDWLPEKSTEGMGLRDRLRGLFVKEHIKLASLHDGDFRDTYYCHSCEKAFCELKKQE